MENRKQLRSVIEGQVSVRDRQQRTIALERIEMSRTNAAFLSNTEIQIGTELNIEITDASPWPNMNVSGHVIRTDSHKDGHWIVLGVNKI